MFGGADLGGTTGAWRGAGKEIQGYKNAGADMVELGKQAGIASQYADPYQQYRAGDAATLNAYVTGTKSITTDPGYQFTQNEAANQVSRAAAARGMNQSGNVMAALQQRGSDIASQQYGTILDRLTGLAGATPQNAIAGGQIYGNMMTTSLTGQADASIGLGVARSNEQVALGEMAHNTANFVGSFFSMGQ